MIKKWVIYILSKRRDIGDNNSLTILQGPNDVWWYPYSLEGYDTEEDAVNAIYNTSDDFVILPVYRN